MNKTKITEIILKTVDGYNAFQSENMRLEKDKNTILFSRAGFTKDGKLDSIGLVNFLVLLENNMKTDDENFNLDVQHLISNKESLLKNLGTLASYLESIS